MFWNGNENTLCHPNQLTSNAALKQGKQSKSYKPILTVYNRNECIHGKWKTPRCIEDEGEMRYTYRNRPQKGFATTHRTCSEMIEYTEYFFFYLLEENAIAKRRNLFVSKILGFFFRKRWAVFTRDGFIMWLDV